ncbi:DUF5062 domain-containing protein [Saccharobesus litoralis]|uniref:DUF5062 domain-containing protein n=1 Tax=Saccharobesus litoralis TaxID=2172099 RepID=A0A2S0VVI9_9ALTE|nr:DUF5062 family protein [Saccharobesus litoralis]AWB68231.1 DUF5062 domain-containing protein [Saccharobesus litoralis]
MKKVKNEKELLKKALQVGQSYAANRGYKAFGPTDSADQKIECIYRLFVQDKLIVALPEDQENTLNIKKRLVAWIMKKLPADHPLLK